MKTGYAFCENCYDDVSYFVEEKVLKTKLKGKEYLYEGKVAYCTKCKEEVYVAELNDYNLERLYEVYRNENNIVSLSIIKSIPEKYNIGKRPLSNLLGWGELTFSRYCDGDMPTKQYSDVLQKIYDNPAYFLEVLNENKDRISNIAYHKSKAATEALLISDSKIELAADYLIDLCQDITHLALQKALYYVQGFYFAFYGSYIFAEECEAWRYGPVYRTVYDKYKNYRFDIIENELKAHDEALSFAEKEILESVAKFFCCYSGTTLRDFTHSEAPWMIARGDLDGHENSQNIICKESIGSYFLNVKEQYNMVVPADMKVYAKEMFERNEKYN